MKEKFSDLNFRPKSLTLISRANEIIAEYSTEGYTLTLRQLYYQLVSRDVIPNTQADYNKLGSLVNDARLAGLIDWAAIEDRTRNLRSVSHWGTPSEIIETAAEQYRIDKWSKKHGQRYRPECWVEKDALGGILDRICTELDVPWFSCRGYTSQSELYGASKRMLKWQRERQTPYVIHLGDHDPSGKDMTRDITDRLRLFTGGRVEVNRIALNFDQIEQYDPPPNPAKTTDSRFAAYQEEFGDESWELDALSPRVISDLITEAVLNVRDEDAWNRAVEIEEAERSALAATSERWSEVTDFLEVA